MLDDAHFQFFRKQGLLSCILTEVCWLFAVRREAGELSAGLGVVVANGCASSRRSLSVVGPQGGTEEAEVMFAWGNSCPLFSVLLLNSYDFKSMIFDKYLATEYDMRTQGQHACPTELPRMPQKGKELELPKPCVFSGGFTAWCAGQHRRAPLASKGDASAQFNLSRL